MEIWAAPCECEHLLADHWFDMTAPEGQPTAGCRECVTCDGFRIAPEREAENAD